MKRENDVEPGNRGSTAIVETERATGSLASWVLILWYSREGGRLSP